MPNPFLPQIRAVRDILCSITREQAARETARLWLEEVERGEQRGTGTSMRGFVRSFVKQTGQAGQASLN